jgi:hypothetical protein
VLSTAAVSVVLTISVGTHEQTQPPIRSSDHNST